MGKASIAREIKPVSGACTDRNQILLTLLRSLAQMETVITARVMAPFNKPNIRKIANYSVTLALSLTLREESIYALTYQHFKRT